MSFLSIRCSQEKKKKVISAIIPHWPAGCGSPHGWKTNSQQPHWREQILTHGTADWHPGNLTNGNLYKGFLLEEEMK